MNNKNDSKEKNKKKIETKEKENIGMKDEKIKFPKLSIRKYAPKFCGKYHQFL